MSSHIWPVAILISAVMKLRSRRSIAGPSLPSSALETIAENLYAAGWYFSESLNALALQGARRMSLSELAARLDLDLYRIDLAITVSKYIGETEKNLRRVFDAYRPAIPYYNLRQVDARVPPLPDWLRDWRGDPQGAPDTGDYLVLHSYSYDFAGRLASGNSPRPCASSTSTSEARPPFGAHRDRAAPSSCPGSPS